MAGAMNRLKPQVRGRQLKRQIRALIERPDFDAKINQLLDMPKGSVTHVLIALLTDTNPVIKWRAVKAMGIVTADLANQDMESARAVMRRLIWSLYEESGGIGWGASEALGEIMACHEGLAEEFAQILVSFAMENGSFLEFEPLQCGVLWGIARLAQVRPPLLHSLNALEYVIPFFDSKDPTVRGMAALAGGLLEDVINHPPWDRLINDQSEISLYWKDECKTVKICDLAKKPWIM